MPHWGTWGNGVRYVDDILIGFSFPFLYQTSSSNNSKALRTIRKEFFMRCPPKWDTLMKLVFYLILPINYDGWIMVAILWFFILYRYKHWPTITIYHHYLYYTYFQCPYEIFKISHFLEIQHLCLVGKIVNKKFKVML